MKNTNLPVTDNKFKSFKQSTPIGNGVITDNGNGSFTFSSSDTNSNCYMLWQKLAVFGETIKLKVKACILDSAGVTVSETCPRLAIQWKDKNGNFKRSVDGYINSTELKEYEISYTINQPVADGDIITCSFGHFRSSLITGMFSEAQVLVENSSLSVRQDIVGGLLNINASNADALPELSYNSNYVLLKPDNISWLNDTTIQITDARLKGTDGTQMSPLWNFDILLNDPNTSDFYKYRMYAGYLNRSTGTINMQLFDATTNEIVNFRTNKTTLISIGFTIYYI